MITMSILLIIGILVACGVMLYVMLNRRDNTMRDYIVLSMFLSILGMVAYLIELNAPGLDAKLTAVKFGYMSKLIVTPMLASFVLEYYRMHVNWLWKLGIYVIPTMLQVFVFTCESNPLYYKDFWLGNDDMIHIKPGPIYFFTMGFTLLLTIFYVACGLYQRKRLKTDSKRLNSYLLLAGCAPSIALCIYLTGLTKNLDPTPLGVMIGILFMTRAIVKYNQLDRDAMLENMTTALVFLDEQNRLAYANPAAYEIVPKLRDPKNYSYDEDLTILLSPSYATVEHRGTVHKRRVTDLKKGGHTQGRLITFDDITEIAARLSRDSMTNLLNHAAFYEHLEKEMTKAKESHAPLCVAISDINSFKRVNDTYGHANGDLVLIELAHVMVKNCKNFEVFRYGGEEFSVIFHLELEEAEAVMQQTLDEFSVIKFPFTKEHITFSYGTAKWNESETSVQLFSRADQLMYTRKTAFHEWERAMKSPQSKEKKSTAEKPAESFEAPPKTLQTEKE